ncbi:MAG: cobalamin-dependent protein [Planctomycetes bacterium]|nr:cobalamin-dependent protein [Planctomycetota bacterium]MCG2683900.1 cobalamin-dependent protein [Planctomycetales bacterium]
MAADARNYPMHPLRSKARVLLLSVFGPYAQDDQYGSRLINPMELYHNQVTRVQHAFSFRSFNRSWGLMLIQVNLKAPCTLLDFPSEERFVEEIKTRRYDVIGISSIISNLFKVRRMCRLARKHQPEAIIVVGGHIANAPDLKKWVDADHVVKGEGVRWMRRFLGEDENQPIRHPRIISNISPRIMGVPLCNHPGIDDATLIPSVGCPMGCNFCSTSAMFGGKGKCIEFYRTGEEIFDIMCALESDLHVKSFFIMDENFLLNQKRALQLLNLMEKHGKPWSLKVFSSVNALQRYTMEQLVALGVEWVWLGLEGKDSQYGKLAGTDTTALVHSLQSHGIHVLGSSIIGIEEHTPENIDEVIDHAVRHNTDLHQFMLYTPIAGTPLYAEQEAKGTLLGIAEFHLADIHGQLKFNFRHAHIKDGEEGEFLLRAFHRDFAVNGPSVVRIIRTLLRGWKRHGNHPNARIRARFIHQAANLPIKYAGALWAARRRFRRDPHCEQLISNVLDELYAEFGWKARLAAPIVGRYLYRTLCREERRLQNGWTYEPPTFFETNSADGQEEATRVEGITPTIARQCTAGLPGRPIHLKSPVGTEWV